MKNTLKNNNNHIPNTHFEIIDYRRCLLLMNYRFGLENMVCRKKIFLMLFSLHNYFYYLYRSKCVLNLYSSKNDKI